MGSSQSTTTTSQLTPKQQDLKFLGDRCPFGDAELLHLYDAYEALIYQQQQRTSFLQDWADACLWSHLGRKRKKSESENGHREDEEAFKERREEWRTLNQVLVTKILPPGFGNKLYESSFLVSGDASQYSTPKGNDKPVEMSSTVDEYTRKARLEAFFEGISSCSRRTAKDALRVVFDACQEFRLVSSSEVEKGVRCVSAKEFVEIGYRLALAVEFLKEARSDDGGNGIQAFLPVDDTENDATLNAFASSIVERRKARKRRQGIFSETKEDGDSDWVDLEDILEWSDSVAPLFAYILQTFSHLIMFPFQATTVSTRTKFAFPRIPDTSAFFSSPNSPLLFTFGALSSSLSGTYHRLYTSDSDGLSFNRLQNAVLGYSGPTLLIIRAVTDNASEQSIFGAFTASPWKESKEFYGNTDCFLFQMAPRTAVYRPSGNDRNFMYCNSFARSRGYDKQAHGIGFGGSTDQPRLFIAESMDDCFAAPNQDMTFEHGSLLPLHPSGAVQKYFAIDSLEVWGVGGDDVVAQALGARTKARELKEEGIRRARKVDKAQFLDDFRSGLVDSKAFKHRAEVDGRADQDLEDLNLKRLNVG